MIEKLVTFAIRNRALIIILFCALGIGGILAWTGLSIDAYPDISDTTVQIVTQVPGLAAEEMEQQITVPVERAVNGIPGLNTMRSKNSFGLSTVILVFDDGIDDYWARQRVNERLTGLELPYDAVPELNPLTAPTGEIFRYIVESPDGSHNLRDLTDIHKWTISPYLRQISGVADVSNYGGITTQYQIELSPELMREYGVSLADITEKVEANNRNAGGSMLMEGDLSYVIRGIATSSARVCLVIVTTSATTMMLWRVSCRCCVVTTPQRFWRKYIKRLTSSTTRFFLKGCRYVLSWTAPTWWVRRLRRSPTHSWWVCSWWWWC